MKSPVQWMEMPPAGEAEPHSVLGVERGAPLPAIRAAYRRLAQLHHPDRVPDEHRARAEETMKRLNGAYSAMCAPRTCA